MVYDKTTRTYGDEQWHCPFSREWVERMKRAASCCRELTTAQIETCLESEWVYYDLPPGDFLSEEQDIRGLPLSYGEWERQRFRNIPDGCTAIYDYCSLPEVVLTDGHNDWAYMCRGAVLTA